MIIDKQAIKNTSIKEYQISLWNPGSSAVKGPEIFGCSVNGLSFGDSWLKPEEDAIAAWNNKIPGLVFSGTFKSVLNSLKTLSFTPVICIALFRHGQGPDLFLKNISLTLPHIPVIGGGAAFLQSGSAGELAPDGEDVTLFAVARGNYTIHSLNIYDNTGISVEVKRKTDREFEFLRILPDGKWQNAVDYFHKQQEMRDIDRSNFELMTFADSNDRNMHFRTDGHSLISGADLPDDNLLFLKVTSREKAEKKLAGFIAVENALIFGCAGVGSLLSKPVYPANNSLLAFMFGEVFTFLDQPMFGNLMLARLTMK
jgi:hypothetical protein